jgi:hypothetical protein
MIDLKSILGLSLYKKNFWGEKSPKRFNRINIKKYKYNKNADIYDRSEGKEDTFTSLTKRITGQIKINQRSCMDIWW